MQVINQYSFFGDNSQVVPLVYRKFHNSTSVVPICSPSPKLYDVVPYCSVSPRGITTYMRNIADNRIHDAMKWEYDNSYKGKIMPISNVHSGTMSYKASSQINDKIDWMLLITKEKQAPQSMFQSEYKWKINMLTVSLPAKQKHTDKFIKSKLLNHFLVILHRMFNVKNYIWRAESQANGNIHFHIITDVFIPYKSARMQWNKVIEKLGYIDDFEKLWKYRDPNSTDIHSIKNVKNLSAYLSKYVSKNSGGVLVPLLHSAFMPPIGFYCQKYKCNLKKGTRFYRPIFGRLWGCSAELSKLKKCRFRLDDISEKELFNIRVKHPNSYKAIEYCRIYSIKAKDLKTYDLHAIRDKLYTYMLVQRKLLQTITC